MSLTHTMERFASITLKKKKLRTKRGEEKCKEGGVGVCEGNNEMTAAGGETVDVTGQCTARAVMRISF